MPSPPAASSDAAIEQYGVLDAPPSRDLQALVELAALVCDVPRAAINLITSGHQHQVAVAGLDAAVCRRQDSMCWAVLDDLDVVVVPDASRDERFRKNPFVTGDLGEVRFYASAPLTTPSGTTFGRLCVFDEVPHHLPAQKGKVLEELAARVVDVLELRLRTAQLRTSLDRLTEARDELSRSNELLNLFAAQVATRLREEELDLDGVLDNVLDDLAPVIEVRRAQVRRGELPKVRADAHLLYLVMLNLVSNAVKLTPPSTVPVVSVRAEQVDEGWRVSVADNGRGVAGLALVRRAVEAHGGHLGVGDAPDVGAEVWFVLPG